MKTVTGLKYLWKLADIDEALVYEHATTYNLAIPLVHTMVSRGLTTRGQIDQFLFSHYEDMIPHSSLLKGAIEAVERIERAIKHKEKILICGDYDVDGVTGSALFMLCLVQLGAQVNFFLPHRVHDGYGLSIATVRRAAESGYTIIITVDNGITSYDAVCEANKLGIEVIITDHHQPHAQLPPAAIIVNPHQPGCMYPSKVLAGVGVAFKVIVLLYERAGQKVPEKVYELLLLGTIADVVPLTGENRYWVRYALRQVNSQEPLFLKKLKKNARFAKQVLKAIDIGFFITPQINALGRLSDARKAVSFLLGSDVQDIEQVGDMLRELNESRKSIEKDVLTDIEGRIASGQIDIAGERVICAGSCDWQPGVIGLVASRLAMIHQRPVLLYHETEAGIAKGSCRSIPGCDIVRALRAHQDLLISCGGHDMAAGFSLSVENLPEFKKRIEEYMRREIPEVDIRPVLNLDAPVKLGDMQIKFMRDMAYLEPFGQGNPQPSFYVHNVTVLDKPVLLKEAHVKCLVFADGVIKPVIFFQRPDLYGPLCEAHEKTVSLAAHVTENEWNGRVSIELQGIDIAL